MEGDSMCGDVESADDDREEWSLVIFSVKKDANLSVREDVGGEEGRKNSCRSAMKNGIDSLPEPFGLKLVKKVKVTHIYFARHCRVNLINSFKMIEVNLR